MRQYSIEWKQDESTVNCEYKEFECLALCMDYARLKCSGYKADKAYIYQSDDPQEKIAVYP